MSASSSITRVPIPVSNSIFAKALAQSERDRRARAIRDPPPMYEEVGDEEEDDDDDDDEEDVEIPPTTDDDGGDVPPPRPAYCDQMIIDDDDEEAARPRRNADALPQPGSIDPDRLVTTDSKVKSTVSCCICLDIVRDPVNCSDACRHHICHSCNQQRTATDKRRCPTCREWAKRPLRRDDFCAIVVASLDVKCVHPQCALVYPIGTDAENDVKHRTTVCAFEPVECKTCQVKIPRGELAAHVCPDRKIQCVQCDEQVKAKDFVKHSEKGPRAGTCAGFAWCTNGCKVAKAVSKRVKTESGVAAAAAAATSSHEEVLMLKSVDLAAHLKLHCPLRLVQCPDCEEQFRDVDTDEHFRHSKQKHKVVMVQRVRDLFVRVKELEAAGGRLDPRRPECVAQLSAFDRMPHIMPTYISEFESKLNVPLSDLTSLAWRDTTETDEYTIGMKMVAHASKSAKLRVTVKRHDEEQDPADFAMAVGLLRKDTATKDTVPGESFLTWRSPVCKDTLTWDTLSLHSVEEDHPDAVWDDNSIRIRVQLWRKA